MAVSFSLELFFIYFCAAGLLLQTRHVNRRAGFRILTTDLEGSKIILCCKATQYAPALLTCTCGYSLLTSIIAFLISSDFWGFFWSLGNGSIYFGQKHNWNLL